MFCDIVIPNGNEADFIEMAKRLGYSSLIFVYPFMAKKQKVENNLDGMQDKSVKLIRVFSIGNSNLNNARKTEGLKIVKAGEKNRQFFESKDINIIYGLEEVSQKDYIHHKASGMNQVLAKLARRNNISVAFSFSMLLKRKGMKKSAIMSRIMQNIKLCRKYKVSMITASFADNPYKLRYPRDMMALMQSLGMEGGEAKESLKRIKLKE